jgi:hypothetical protein
VDALGAFAVLAKDIVPSPGQWLSNLGAGAQDGVRNHLWGAFQTATQEWFNQKVEEVLGLGMPVWKVLNQGGIKTAEVGKMAWDGIKSAIPPALIQILIEKVISMIVPAAGAVLAIIEGLQAAWGTVSRVIQAFDRFMGFLKAVKTGQSGPQFGAALAAAGVVLIDFVSNWLLKRVRGAASKVAGKVKEIAKKIGRKLKAATKKLGGKFGKAKDKFFGKKGDKGAKENKHDKNKEGNQDQSKEKKKQEKLDKTVTTKTQGEQLLKPGKSKKSKDKSNNSKNRVEDKDNSRSINDTNKNSKNGDKTKDNKDKKGKDGKPDQRTEKQKKADLNKALAQADQLLKDDKISSEQVKKRLPGIKSKYKMTFLELIVDSKGDAKEIVHVEGIINPRGSTAKRRKVDYSEALKKAKSDFPSRLFSKSELETSLGLSSSTALKAINKWKEEGQLYTLASASSDPLTQYSFDKNKAGQRDTNPNNRSKYGYSNPKKDSDVGLKILSKGLRSDSPQPILRDDASYHKEKARYHSTRPGSIYTDFEYSDAILGHKDPGASGHWNRIGHKQSKAANQAWNKDPNSYQGPEHEKESSASGASAERYKVPSKAIGSHPDWW